MVTPLSRILHHYKKQLQILTREYDPNDTRTLVPNHRRDKTYFYEYNNGDRKGITYDDSRIYSIAHNIYLDTFLDELRERISILELAHISLLKSAQNSEVPEILTKFHQDGLNITRIACSKWQISKIGKQSQNPYKREKLIYGSEGGTMTRSKTERSICTCLEHRPIPFAYEMEILVDVTGLDNVEGSFYRDGRRWKIIYPDFTIFLADGSILIIEHLGRMDDKEYRKKNGEKILLLLYSGTVDTDHLLVTFEEDFQSMSAIYEFIDSHILPYV